MKHVLLACASLMTLSACATAPAAPVVETPLTEVQIAPPPELVKVAVPTPQRELLKEAPREVGKRTPQEALADANKAARQRPGPEGFVDATYVYDYQPGAIYELYATPAFVSTILLEPGETLADTAAGDTTRWTVSETVSGAGDAPRTLVMVKPKAIGLKTNIVLVTDRRSYLIEASSVKGETYSAQIAWRYPDVEPQLGAAIAPSPSRGVAIDTLNFAYRIRVVQGRIPRWAPVRAFDDGRRTWIEFPADIAASDMPPLFVRTGEGAELVNYRIQGSRYVIDRVFDVGELRLGRKKPVVVRIERQNARRSIFGLDLPS